MIQSTIIAVENAESIENNWKNIEYLLKPTKKVLEIKDTTVKLNG